jgi:hypothetical protein
MSHRVKIIQAALYIMVIGVGVYLVRGFIRQYVAQPIFIVGTYLYQAYTALPQQLVWSLLILAGAWVAIQVVINVRLPKQPDKAPVRYYPSRVENWERWLNFANEGELNRLKLARELTNLTLETLANREGQNFSNIRRGLQNGSILLPDEVIKLMKSTPVGNDIHPLTKLIHRFTRSGQKSSFHPEVEETVRYLESELEVQSGESSH